MRLIAGLPEGSRTSKLELAALTIVGVPRIALFGYAAAEVEATYRRTVELVERVGDKVQLFQGLRGLWNCIYDRADLTMPGTSPNGCARWPPNSRGRKRVVSAIARWARPALSLGRFADSIDAFEKCAAAAPRCRLTLDFASTANRRGSSAASMPDLRMRSPAISIARNGPIDEALAAAQRLDHPLTFAFAHHIAANVQYLLAKRRNARDLVPRHSALARNTT